MRHAVFLRSINVTVPIVFGHDPELHGMIMEDAGNADLWSFRTLPWKDKRALYCKTLETVYRLHSFPVKDFPFGKVKLMDGFDTMLYDGNLVTSGNTLWKKCAGLYRTVTDKGSRR